MTKSDYEFYKACILLTFC